MNDFDDIEDFPLRVTMILEPMTNHVPILDRPRPKSEGAIEKRYIAKGDPQKAYYIKYYNGVPYARIVPLKPNEKEYARVKEAGDNGFEWFGVIELYPPAEISIAKAIRDGAHEIAEAIAGKK